MIIDPTYFRGILSLGHNLYTGAPDITTAANVDDLQEKCDIYEGEYMRLLLNPDDYADITLFLNGSETGTETDWSGLVRLLKGSKTDLSPVACYAYFRILEDLTESVTAMGTVANAERDARNPMHKQIKAWNMGADANQRAAQWLHEHGKAVNDNSLLRYINSLGI